MRRCFTFIEIVITVIIILIIATLGGTTYQQLLENARAKVCAVNLKALDAAVEAYTLESDAFPASLGELKTEQLMKAYAEVIKKDNWWTKFSYVFVRLNTPREAYAKILTPSNLKRFGLSPQILHCPDDAQKDHVSYGVNSNYIGKSWGEIPEDANIVADCGKPTFSSEGDLAYRHWGRSSLFTYKYAQVAVKKSKKVKKIKGKIKKIKGKIKGEIKKIKGKIKKIKDLKKKIKDLKDLGEDTKDLEEDLKKKIKDLKKKIKDLKDLGEDTKDLERRSKNLKNKIDDMKDAKDIENL